MGNLPGRLGKFRSRNFREKTGETVVRRSCRNPDKWSVPFGVDLLGFHGD